MAHDRSPPIDASRVSPRLYVGSRPEAGPLLHDLGFHVIVLCALPEEYGGGRYGERYHGVEVVACPLDDSERPISRAELSLAEETAARVATAVYRGRRALVTCMQGRNRSALVAALVLRRLTRCSGRRASEMVRTAREATLGPGTVLCNASFNRYLRSLPSLPWGAGERHSTDSEAP